MAIKYNNKNMRRKKSNTKKYAYMTIGLILSIIIIGFLMLQSWYNRAIYGEYGEEVFTLIVDEGETFIDIAGQLEEDEIIPSKTAVQFYLRYKGLNPAIKVGTYDIAPNFSIPDLIEILESGAFKPAIWVTVKEGLRYEQIGELLEDELSDTTTFSYTEFSNIVENPSLVTFSQNIDVFLRNNKPTTAPLRGFLYPDTYRFDADMTTTQIVEVFLNNFINKYNENVAPIIGIREPGNNFASVYEGLILASIIEREASAWDDRADISGVFHNRLGIGMLLQSDATVNFVTGKNDAGVSFRDKEVDSPYNTYRYIGLPPTPINNPRIQSLEAALNPNETPYYFFYHTPDGETFFNVDFESHSAGVCRDLGC